MGQILIVEDDLVFNRMLGNWLNKKQLSTVSTSTVADARKALGRGGISLVLSDLRLPDGNGVELLEWMNGQSCHIPFIVMTCYGQIANAVKAIKLGAVDYLCKPLQPEDLYLVISEALNLKINQDTNTTTASYFQGKSAAVQECRRLIKLVAPTDMAVLIRGANGTGKEYAARSIHTASDRAKKPFIALDCGAIPRELAPSEFFGHSKGAFTGASDNKSGVFGMAEGGTLFLDEIGNLSYEVQVLLLRALQEKRYRPVGSTKETTMDVRILAATNGNLEKAIEEGRFREDLYHRLDEFTIYVPSLAECREDILPLADFFREQACRDLKKQVDGFDVAARAALENHTWPGNIREMRNKIRKAILLTDGKVISERDLCIIKTDGYSERYALKDEKEEQERIMRVLELTHGNKRLAADMLRIDRSTLYEKIKKYGMTV